MLQFTNDSDENKKAKGKFDDHKNCLEVKRFENKIIYLKNNTEVHSLKENHKEPLKDNRLIVTSKQIFKSDKHVSTKEVNKITLTADDGKRIQTYLEKHMRMEQANRSDVKLRKLNIEI